METKVAGEKAKEITASLRFSRPSIIDADGLAKGIWLLWDDTFQVNVLNERAQVIHAMVKVNSHPSFSNFIWYLSAVYGHPQFETRSLFWENLKQFSQVIQGPRLVIGDFNDVTCQDEKFGVTLFPNTELEHMWTV
ncbi:hypothetical protein SLA2020_056100 [Shorea laevis]